MEQALDTDLLVVAAHSDGIGEIGRSLTANVAAIAGMFLLLDKVVHWWKQKEEEHRRAALLAAYRRRHRWKAADAARVRAIGASPVALRRAARARGRGRPVVAEYRSLGDTIVHRAVRLKPMIDALATPRQRREAIRSIPGWEILVEIVYRAEVMAARARREAEPAASVERRIAAVLCIADGTVHAICHRARRSGLAATLDASQWSVPLVTIERWIDMGLEIAPPSRSDDTPG